LSEKKSVIHIYFPAFPLFLAVKSHQHLNNTSQHDFAVKQKIGYFNGNRCPESENGVNFFISHLVVAQLFFFSIYSRTM
jgi:hypothetical protein